MEFHERSQMWVPPYTVAPPPLGMRPRPPPAPETARRSSRPAPPPLPESAVRGSRWTADDVELNFGPLLKSNSTSSDSLGSEDNVQPGGVPGEGKRAREKRRTLEELVQTECTYQGQLAVFIEKLQRPLSQLVYNGYVPNADAAALERCFGPLPAKELLAISEEFVSAVTTRGAGYDDATFEVGDVFAFFATRVHDSMCIWYDHVERADIAVREMVAQSTWAATYVAEALQAEARCPDGQLSSLLIAPTQRLVRQALFIQRLAKSTPPSHADFDALKSAEKTWTSILEECNKVAGASTIAQRVEALASVLDGAPPNVIVTAAGRELTHEGSLTKIGNASVRPDCFFLFETHSATELLHTTSRDANGRYQFKRFLRVLHVEDVEVVSEATGSSGEVHKSYVDGVDEDALVLRLVAAEPSDSKLGHIFSLAGPRNDVIKWKSKVTSALGKGSAEWKLRFKGEVAVLAEGYAQFACAEVKDQSLRYCFMWFFSGRFGGMIVRAVSKSNFTGKLKWHEALRVESVDDRPIHENMVRGSRLAERVREDDVFRISCAEKTLVVASDDKALIVELMQATG